MKVRHTPFLAFAALAMLSCSRAARPAVAVQSACDSAAALATRRGASSVLVNPDTIDQVAAPACIVHIAGYAARADSAWALFRPGIPGAKWRVNDFEGSAPEDGYALWHPGVVFCDVVVRRAAGGRSAEPQPIDTLGFDVECTKLAPSDTPRVVASGP
jgi:hypothetical protein